MKGFSFDVGTGFRMGEPGNDVWFSTDATVTLVAASEAGARDILRKCFGEHVAPSGWNGNSGSESVDTYQLHQTAQDNKLAMNLKKLQRDLGSIEFDGAVVYAELNGPRTWARLYAHEGDKHRVVLLRDPTLRSDSQDSEVNLDVLAEAIASKF